MQKYFITFRSVTYAQRGERILTRQEIVCHLRRAQKWMETRGCGYALEVRDPEAAVRLLREQKAVFEKVYRLSETGNPEVICL